MNTNEIKTVETEEQRKAREFAERFIADEREQKAWYGKRSKGRRCDGSGCVVRERW